MRLRDTWPETGLMGRWGRWANQVAKILNGAVGYGTAQVFITPRGLEVHGGGAEEGAPTVFPARIFTWSDGYEWIEQEVDAATGNWQDKETGLSSEGNLSGSQDQVAAFEFSGLEDLPDHLIVWMCRVVDDEGDATWRFLVPHQSNRNQAEIKLPITDEEAAQTDTWDIEEQIGRGLHLTELVRIAHDWDGDDKLYAYYRTKVYDAAGHLLSVSAETRVEVADKPFVPPGGDQYEVLQPDATGKRIWDWVRGRANLI